MTKRERKMVKDAWAMFTDDEKYLMLLQDIGSEEQFLEFVDVDWDIISYRDAEDLYKSIKKEFILFC